MAVLAMVAAACSSSKSSSSSTTAAPNTTAATATTAANSTAGNTASATGITPDTITVGVVIDETGVAASNDKGYAAFKARIDAQNDAGGIFGRKIKLVFEDGQSSATENLTAVQKIVLTSNPFVMVDDSYALSSSYRYLVAAEDPDGHRWLRRAGVRGPGQRVPAPDADRQHRQELSRRSTRSSPPS